VPHREQHRGNFVSPPIMGGVIPASVRVLEIVAGGAVAAVPRSVLHHIGTKRSCLKALAATLA